ncbi:hypothetical protein K488DRAFT_83453 [Vararia minispora EC-137]|uniref:Uncharacterized protein n=1 Tax=Vararia minispora EC-137 TaxID=1314806 RepID=A0ACB8QSX7_9AGAM|nr:hypothetical protein K488DRAFT_83453 [Vararia minispora EC-137]
MTTSSYVYNATTLLLDDRHPWVQYLYNSSDPNAWIHGGSNSEFGVTTTGTNRPGAYMQIFFVGSAIEVYGTIPPNGTFDLTFQIEGSGKSTPFSSPQTTSVAYRQRVYSSGPDLGPGAHTLTMTYLNGTANGGGIFWVDYLLFTPSALTASPDVVSAQVSVIPATVTAQQSAPESSVSPVNSQSPTKTPARIGVGPIVGGAVGAFFTIVAISGLVFLWYKRRRTTPTSPVNEEKTMPNLSPDPFPRRGVGTGAVPRVPEGPREELGGYSRPLEWKNARTGTPSRKVFVPQTALWDPSYQANPTLLGIPNQTVATKSFMHVE